MSGPVDGGPAAREWLARLYSEAEFELNPTLDDCWHCGGEGWTYDCIDGCCEDAEEGCELCARRCPECRLHERAVQERVRRDVAMSLSVPLGRAFIASRDDRVEAMDVLTDNGILASLHGARSGLDDLPWEDRAASACWVEGLL